MSHIRRVLHVGGQAARAAFENGRFSAAQPNRARLWRLVGGTTATGGGATLLALGGWLAPAATGNASEPHAPDTATTTLSGNPSFAEVKLIREADILYEAFLVENLYKLLRRYADSSNAEVLWRLARATCEMAKRFGISDQERKQYMYEAYEHIQKAIDFEPAHGNFAVHKWYAILLDYVSEYEGTKVRLENSPKVREHFQKAYELNPTDATTVHLIGVWCFTFADLPGYQRRLAGWVFAQPPSSTYEEALDYFLKAESIEPNFYSKNLLYIGKIYAKLDRKEEAREYLQRAFSLPVVSPDDMEAHKEADHLLKHL